MLVIVAILDPFLQLYYPESVFDEDWILRLERERDSEKRKIFSILVIYHELDSEIICYQKIDV